MANLMFLQGVAHVVDMVGTAVERERFDICVNLLDNLNRSNAPADHKRGVQYACQVLLNPPMQNGASSV